MKRKSIKFNNLDVELIFKSNMKNIRLRIDKNAKILLSLPSNCPEKRAFEFLQNNQDWLFLTHQKVLNSLPKSDDFAYLGQIYKIVFDENFEEILIKDDKIFAPNPKKLEKFKKAEARSTFLNLIDKFSPVIKCKINKITIREMNSRWGSCNSKKGYINLNLKLIEKPIYLIEYVVLHELAHLIFPHHQKTFYDFIRNLMPDFKNREKDLNKK